MKNKILIICTTILLLSFTAFPLETFANEKQPSHLETVQQIEINQFEFHKNAQHENRRDFEENFDNYFSIFSRFIIIFIATVWTIVIVNLLVHINLFSRLREIIFIIFENRLSHKYRNNIIDKLYFNTEDYNPLNNDYCIFCGAQLFDEPFCTVCGRDQTTN